MDLKAPSKNEWRKQTEWLSYVHVVYSNWAYRRKWGEASKTVFMNQQMLVKLE